VKLPPVITEPISIRLASVFGDGMVFQRGKPINLWGEVRGKTIANITIHAKLYRELRGGRGSFYDDDDATGELLEDGHATTSGDGSFFVSLPAQDVGAGSDVEPDEAGVRVWLYADNSQNLYIRNAALGDVFMCAGQSNMQVCVHSCVCMCCISVLVDLSRRPAQMPVPRTFGSEAAIKAVNPNVCYLM
jgi:sialate O-acetylesterase